ncbi:MAG: 2-hydroxychromene-2-carboxylate isomerase [Gammaproteobacteria bacterium]|nr:2-hydroxychromene-2-carboxylate isomerase [Gammaproteobacteria bacterium]
MVVEYFFDCSSPWTYLAFSRIKGICEATAAELVWKPVLVGGVFNAVNQSVYEQRSNPVPAKARYYQKDLQDWAGFQNIVIGQPEVFPVNSVKAMRGVFVAMEEDCVSAYVEAVFRTYWSDLKDISQIDVLTDIVSSVGMNADEFFAKINDQDYKDKLKDNTDELIQRGGFGSPTFFIDTTDMYFGNDRLPLIEARLKGWSGSLSEIA